MKIILIAILFSFLISFNNSQLSKKPMVEELSIENNENILRVPNKTYCSMVRFAFPCKGKPVCGYKVSPCLVAPCPVEETNYDNGCDACTNGNVTYFELGKCKKDSIPPTPTVYTCKDSDRNNYNCRCSNRDEFVCALIKKNFTYHVGDGNEYYKCRCEACSDRHVINVNQGLCSDHNELSRYNYYVCKDSDRNKPCTREYKGVCALTENGIEEVATTCTGCSRDDVYAVYDGKCPMLLYYP